MASTWFVRESHRCSWRAATHFRTGIWSPRASPSVIARDIHSGQRRDTASSAARHHDTMASPQRASASTATKPRRTGPPPTPRPSSSILLISPSNEILLLHRVQTSTSFASAHVFPGGNLAAHDGDIPPATDPKRHEDGLAYRVGAIRECFEESGILLAKRRDGSGALLELPDDEREQARRDIHSEKMRFTDWVRHHKAILDTDSLIPFTRWITPTNVPKRFTTQMYIYFLPLPPSPLVEQAGSISIKTESVIPVPTSDGGIEHTAAEFAPCATWISRAQRGEVVLFPPQFYLMTLLAPFLDVSAGAPRSFHELQQQRDRVMAFLETDGDGSGTLWADKVMSPVNLFLRQSDKRVVLALDKPGPELAGSGRRGDAQRVVLVSFGKEGPRNLDVRGREEVFEEERRTAAAAKL